MKSALNMFCKIFLPPLRFYYFDNPSSWKWPRLMITLFILATVPIVNANNKNTEEPIAYIGHGAFFDNKGKQIVPTFEFITKSQDWYQKKLLQKLSHEKSYAFELFEKKINNLNAYGQTRLIARQYVLDWLMANTLKPQEEARMQGKIHALKVALNLELLESDELSQLHQRREFKLDRVFAKNLHRLKVTPVNDPVAFATTNQGQDYIDECSLAGVPIPPTIGSAMWQSQGFIPTSEQFIVGTPAEVRTYQSFAPDGMCIALPRYNNNTLTNVELDGVICLGESTSNVCIWDNQMSGNTFSFPPGTMIPIGVPNLAINPAGQYMAGGFELNGGTGGVCADCHAGENPYIIHPDAMLSASLDMGDLGNAPLNLPMFAADRFDPHVAASWPQNQLSMAQPLVPGACVGCHVQGGSGGRFPHLSTELPGYCGTVLAQAITDTMPPFNPGGAAADPEVINFQNDWCSSPVGAGPSNRGDPHLTTTNGVNYDFQSEGEFTALRNSASGFELQTRQTGVETTFTPGANPYTGLASCVSLNTAAAVRVGKHRISYQPSPRSQRMVLRINNKLVDLPRKGIDLGDGNKIANASSGGGIEVFSSDDTRVIITPNYWSSQGYSYLNIEVLNTPAREGTMGHILSSHWLPLAPDGSSFGSAPASLNDRHILLNQKFADAWRVTNASSLFDYDAGTSTDDFTNRNWPPEPGKECKIEGSNQPPVKPMSPERAKALCRIVKDEVAFENCVFDATVLGDEGIAEAYQKTLKVRNGQ